VRQSNDILRSSLSRAQGTVFQSPARFRVLVAGRRFGKTHLALVELIHTAWNTPGLLCWYLAPSYRQAKRIAWERLKSMVYGYPRTQPLETDLTIRFPNGSSIALRGADRYDSLRGNGLDFVVLDEFASMRPEVWTDAIRPALADRKGRALFIGTPQGHNHLYERFEYAQSQSDWAAFRFSTLDGGNVTAGELAAAAGELDERLFRQEFEASFDAALVGRAYHAFSSANIRPCQYRPGARLIWSLDFNVNPMCSVLAQAHDGEVEVLDELILHDANTVLACERFWERIRSWRTAARGLFEIDIHGDSSGYARRSSASFSDWHLIRNFFAQHSGQALAHIKAGNSNPAVRDRINIVNSRLLSAAGDRRLFVDPRCKELILDLEQITWHLDDFGQPTSELDKSDRMRTHASDALGYYLAAAFPFTSKFGERRDRLF